MKPPTQSRPRSLLVLHAVTGGLCVLSAFAIRTRPEIELHWGWVAKPLVTAGLLFLLIGVLMQRTAWARITARAGLACSSVLVVLVLAEMACRLAGWDFRQQERLWRRHPPFYRQPMYPTGPVYFRRTGPETWTGSVIRMSLQLSRRDPSPYALEPPTTICYDQFGFRNDSAWSDWEIAVAGDSFTELGHLPYERLFTTMLSLRQRLRVRNLGVSYTGPLTQLSYLEDYGKAPSLRRAIIVFFEGNDFADLNSEYKALLSWETTGKRPLRQFHKQTSLLRAAGERVRKGWRMPPPDGPMIDAVFMSDAGPVPITVGEIPASREDVPPFILAGLERFAADYARFGKSNNVQTWLAYMPCKARVLFHRMKTTEQATQRVKNWAPSDLAALVAGLCARHGIRFVDLTPALMEETRRTGDLLFNALYDCHLNARGSEVVAQELSKRLGEVEGLPNR